MTSTRGARVLAYATFLVVVLVLIGAVVLSSRTSAIAEGNAVSACRGGYSARMMAHVVEVILIQSEGLEAIAVDDPAARDDAIERLRGERDATRAAQADYLDASARSQSDPAAFLAECQED